MGNTWCDQYGSELMSFRFLNIFTCLFLVLWEMVSKYLWTEFSTLLEKQRFRLNFVLYSWQNNSFWTKSSLKLTKLMLILLVTSEEDSSICNKKCKSDNLSNTNLTQVYKMSSILWWFYFKSYSKLLIRIPPIQMDVSFSSILWRRLSKVFIFPHWHFFALRSDLKKIVLCQ